jgi:hypothetical protein
VTGALGDRVWWHRADRVKAKARLKRRAYPIHAYIGPNGSGKSYAASYDTMLSLAFGRPVLSTVRLLDWTDAGPCPGGAYCDDPDNHETVAFRWYLAEQDSGPPVLTGERYLTGEVHRKAHPFYVPWVSYQQLIEWRDGDVFADEITGFASSREIKNMPPQVANYLVQLRRRNVVLRWTTPSWGRADTIIREVTQAVTLCVGMAPKRRVQDPSEAPRLWRDNRLFVVRTYDPHEFDEVEARRLENAKPGVWSMYWRPRALTESAYDTLDVVAALGWANEAGMCITCGGQRRTPGCGCDDHKKSRERRGPRAASEAKRGVPSLDPEPHPLVSPTVAELLPEVESQPLELATALALSGAEWTARDGDK